MKKLISLLLALSLILSLSVFTINAEDEKLDKSTWKAEASSVHGNFFGSLVLDNNRATYWHTYYEVIDGVAGNKTPPPYELTIDLGGEYVISGFSYVPRTGESSTGRVTEYAIYGSDGSENYVLIGSGSFENNEDIKDIKFKNNIPVSKIKYKILKSVGGCGVVAEFDLFKADPALTEVALSSVEAETFVLETTKAEAPKAENTATGFEAPPTTARKVEGTVPVDERYVDKNGWTAYAEQSYAKGETAEKSIDGDPMTYWHSYFKTVDGVNKKAPMPYDMIYTLPSVATVSGFCYTPRQNDGSTSGIVLEYELYVSSDDSDSWVKVAAGKFTNDKAMKAVRFVCNIDVKKVMFRITSGLNGYAVIGEFDLMVKRDDLETVALSEYASFSEDNKVTYIGSSEIWADASSSWEEHGPGYAFDGSQDTFWHKKPEDKGLIVLSVDLGREYDVAGFVYYPRRGDIKGHWKRYNVFASADGEEYFTVLEGATFEDIDFTTKDVRFSEPKKMRYIEFEIEEYQGHCAAAEIEFYQTGDVVKEEKKAEKYVLQIDNPVIKSEIGEAKKDTTLDVAPYIRNGNTMIPLRGLLEEMGATIEWNGDNQSITVKKGLTTIEMQIRRKQVYVTNAKGTVRYSFRTTPIIKDSRTFIPLRFISEHLGYVVEWNGDTREITIKTPEEK